MKTHEVGGCATLVATVTPCCCWRHVVRIMTSRHRDPVEARANPARQRQPSRHTGNRLLRVGLFSFLILL